MKFKRRQFLTSLLAIPAAAVAASGYPPSSFAASLIDPETGWSEWVSIPPDRIYSFDPDQFTHYVFGFAPAEVGGGAGNSLRVVSVSVTPSRACSTGNVVK